tara:strand:- start:12174 stop:12539 length:366 start_codon:yes stop_codon:yes gene_type:complete
MHNKSKNHLLDKKTDLSLCSKCKKHHLLFIILGCKIILKQEKINNIKNHINGLGRKYWEENFRCSSVDDKINDSTCKENLMLIFNKKEVQIFKSLFKNFNRSKILTVGNDKYYLSLYFSIN